MMCISRRHVAENGGCKHQVGRSRKGLTAKFSWNGEKHPRNRNKKLQWTFVTVFTTVLVDSAHVAYVGLQAEFMVQERWHIR